MIAIVRPERPGDIAAIHAVTSAAFADATHSSGTEAAIVDALRDDVALTLSLVADDSGAIVGHLAFSPVTITSGAAGWFGLGPVSVLPARQRGGIGRALIEAGLSVLRKNGAAGCVVLGDPEYYRRFGFRKEPALRYGDVPPEYFQALSFDATMPRGEVAYHACFEAS